uniref:Uncharacterized protein n=1 Tax=Fagus sylvatica TaxID=28930 RepID=A0A2N9IEL7_FAGSY
MESFGYHDSNIYDLLENRHYNVRQLVEHLGCHFEVPGSSPTKLLLDYPIHGSGGCGRVCVIYRSGVGLKGPAPLP